MCMTGIQLVKLRTFRIEQAVGLLPVVPPTVAYLWYSLGIEQKAPMIWWHPLLVKKITGLVYPFLSYNLFLDLFLGLLFVVLIVLSLRNKATHTVSRGLMLVSRGLYGPLYLCPYERSPIELC